MSLFKIVIILECFFLIKPVLSEIARCGEPLVLARQTVGEFSVNNAVRLSESDIIFYINKISSQNIERLRSLIYPLNIKEQIIYTRAISSSFFITHRLPLSRLRSVLKLGALLSPIAARNNSFEMHKPFTPFLESELFGGHGCVFASIGPSHGRDYGNVLLRISQDNNSFGWGSLSSGYHFMKSLNPLITSPKLQTNMYEALAYSTTITSKAHWKEYFALMIISFLRSKVNPKREILINYLLSENNREKFWQIIDENKIGYLEAKYFDHVSLSSIESIEILDGNSSIICRWPEAAPYLDKIKGCH